MSSTTNDNNQVAIDEGLYSRQLYVLGHDAMKRMGSSNILIIGARGLGVEIAKNIILAGVKSVTIHDPNPVDWTDLSSQFYLSESVLGQPRDRSSLPQLALLNQYVTVSVLDEELAPAALEKFQVVVCTETELAKQLEINQFTHQNNIRFISADIRGLFASVFCDFGSNFQCHDTNGENPVSGMIAAISSDKESVVTCLEETRHNLEDGDYVQFTEIKGMEALNGAEPRKVKYLGPYTFSIGDTTGLGNYISGGLFNQVKVPVNIEFKSLQESLKEPEYLITDYAKFERPQQLHIAFQALDQFQSENGGQLPRSYNEQDAQRVVQLAQQLAQSSPQPFDVDTKLIQQLAYGSRGQLSPMAAVIGGLTAQEVLKAVSGKFNPIRQHLYFDSLESLPADLQITEELAKPLGTRYDGQIAVFGKEFQDVIANSRHFLVGAGAIGCEMLKNWAMMGLAAGQSGSICVTDMDIIEKSNLNRQFLFRPKDVGHLKSDTAAAAVTQMNPDLEGKIISRQDRVGQDTEHIYDEEFFNDLTVVTNALDNVEARTYMDRRCVFFRKPLLESGTLGTKGNTQVVIPDLTESYSSSQDPPEKSIPICTLKNFPNAIEHTIQWARDLFEGFFKQQPENTNQYLSQADYIAQIIKQGGNPKDTIVAIKDSLVDNRAQSLQDCVTWARLQFQEYYYNVIAQLLFNFPPDAVTSSGTPFWSGPKRVPTPIEFDENNDLHVEFILAAANLRAFNFGIPGTRDVAKIKELVGNVIVPEFVPKSGVKIQVNENEPVNNDSSTGSQELDELIDSLPSASQLSGLVLTPSEFEKDDDHNHHIDFITAASNLRATNYGIKNADRHNTKFIAGKIIPAIATTTSLVTGLVCLELYKVLDRRSKLEDYKNGFVNLALPYFGFSEPVAPKKFKYHEVEFTLWDRFEILSDLTLQELIDYFKREHELEITMMSCGVTMIYSNFLNKKKMDERLPMKLSQVVELVSKKPIEAHTKSLILEVCCNDRDDEDVEVPFIKVVIR